MKVPSEDAYRMGMIVVMLGYRKNRSEEAIHEYLRAKGYSTSIESLRQLLGDLTRIGWIILDGEDTKINPAKEREIAELIEGTNAYERALAIENRLEQSH